MEQQKEGHKFYYSCLLVLISFAIYSDPQYYVHMDVPLSYLGKKYWNLWEDKTDSKRQEDNNITFFLHVKALFQVVQQIHQIRTATVQRYASFIKFEVDMHQINLLPLKGPPRHIHQARFVVTDDDVDAIIKLWPKEWCGPLAEPLPE